MVISSFVYHQLDSEALPWQVARDLDNVIAAVNTSRLRTADD
jgi:hypothetical protein